MVVAISIMSREVQLLSNIVHPALKPDGDPHQHG